jgi:hypothetical protein
MLHGRYVAGRLEAGEGQRRREEEERARRAEEEESERMDELPITRTSPSSEPNKLQLLAQLSPGGPPKKVRLAPPPKIDLSRIYKPPPPKK